MITWTLGIFSRNRAVQTMPDSPGRWMSISTTSGLSGGILTSASSAEPQAHTQRCPAVLAIKSERYCRRVALSSTMAIFVLTSADSDGLARDKMADIKSLGHRARL